MDPKKIFWTQTEAQFPICKNVFDQRLGLCQKRAWDPVFAEKEPGDLALSQIETQQEELITICILFLYIFRALTKNTICPPSSPFLAICNVCQVSFTQQNFRHFQFKES